MKKYLLASLVSFVLLQNTLPAVLPPLWQGVREIEAILSDKHFGKELDSGESILEIKKTENGYLIITNRREHPVHIIYKPQSRPGPAQFEIEFGTPKTTSTP
jgi:hypothetical protein